MARPRIFISSTFYDLRQVREDLERFIKTLGYEPVRHETGSIPYGKESSLEEYAYREIGLCDIMLCIIGGRFGTELNMNDGYSITQKELKRALERGIQVFIFVDQNVLSEFATYELNKENIETKYRFADNVKIYKFIEEVSILPNNNPIAPFSTSVDIITYLQTQWAGLFQRFLQEQKRISEIKLLDEMKTTAKTLQQLVNFLTEERKNKDQAIQSILLANHPAFRSFASATRTPYRVFFSNMEELDIWLSARNWEKTARVNMDEDSIYEWHNDNISKYLKLTEDIFNEEKKLKIYTQNDWNNDWIQQIDISPSTNMDNQDYSSHDRGNPPF